MKLKFLFMLFLILSGSIIPCIAQDAQPVPEPDDDFNVFLLIVGTIFIGGMLGAALLGGLLAMAVIGFIFILITIGLVSTSVLIGVYKKSLSAGFNSFLIFLFGFGCAILGSVGVYLINLMIDRPLSNSWALLLGLISGGLGGVLLGFATSKVIRHFLSSLSNKLIRK